MLKLDPGKLAAVQRFAALNRLRRSRNAPMSGASGCWMVGCVRLNVV
nr:MAG TPA: hypothetical protein [Caudoviricetes sp.]